MADILKELYDSSLYGCIDASDELKDLRHKETELWDKVLPILGMDTIDEINNTQGAIARENNLQWYRNGFLLGASLMLELMD